MFLTETYFAYMRTANTQYRLKLVVGACELLLFPSVLMNGLK